jgi:prepilin-type N-terminal cleavage/methylation domain-containing protein
MLPADRRSDAMPTRHARPRRRAFTLIELLAVVSIIALLVALLLPAAQSAREAARRVQCLNNLKQVGIALHGYHDAVGAYPPGILLDIDGITPGWGWGFHLLPHLEQRAVYDSANLQQYLFQGSNETVGSAHLAGFLCPSGGGTGPFDSGFLGIRMSGRKPPAVAQYVASSGWLRVGWEAPGALGIQGKGDGVFYRNSRTTIADVADGLGPTLFVGERSRNVADATWAGSPAATAPLCTKTSWPVEVCESSMFMVLGRTGGPSPDLLRVGAATTSYIPNAPEAGPDGFWSRHPGACHFLMGDGGVRAIRPSVARPAFAALGSRAGGEVVGGTDF